MVKNTPFIVWLAIETFVRILIAIGIIILLSELVSKIILVIIILLFIYWAFNPLRNSYKFYRESKPKKKKR